MQIKCPQCGSIVGERHGNEVVFKHARREFRTTAPCSTSCGKCGCTVHVSASGEARRGEKVLK